ncbi:MAG: biopolymer transporter ExbD [Synechococcaceae cyanobacterium RM1_1_27]|nr:biopolymer transporter ExbD [Synechococcaceae cyanobacterium SM2_3_2]NJO85924.1 biopolymer transporter ExbD [Synechococcaceae cyanobacterium RM1_1_27]
MRIPAENSKTPEINIVPLIDVVFSILVFFIIASLELTRSQGLDVNLPDAAAARSQLQPDVTVSVTAEDQIAVNEEEVAIGELIAKVEQVLRDSAEDEEDPEAPRLVVINADLGLTHGRVVEVMDALQRVSGFEVNLAIAAQRPGSNP